MFRTTIVIALTLLSATPLLLSCDEPATSPTVQSPLAGRLKQHVRRITEEWPERGEQHPETLEKVAQYISAELQAAGLKPFRQEFEVEGRSYSNVRALIGKKTGRRIVVGAHYDVAGRGPGADDNASGVAALIEIGRVLAKRLPKATVEVVAYSLEEPPHFGSERMGSAKHAELLRDENVDVEWMVSLEMLGYYSKEKGSQRYPSPLMKALYPDHGNFVAVVGRIEDAKLVKKLCDALNASLGVAPAEAGRKPDVLTAQMSILPVEVGLIGLSDHRNYWAQGFHAVMLTDTADLRNANYHRRSDTYEKLDYETMARVVEAMAAAIVDLAQVEEKAVTPR